jgi:cytoskeletal protein CcmA (bactofilin family)
VGAQLQLINARHLLVCQLAEPDMIIGSKNKMKGDIKFEGILRIDGTLEGNIIAPYEVTKPV